MRDWLPNDACSVAKTLEIIGERWTMLVLREAFLGTRRFDDLQRNIGCARNILSDRLQKLVGAGILQRRQYQERPPRFEYRLTKAGVGLYPAIVALMRWGDEHRPGGGGPAIVLEHVPCGHHITPELMCPGCLVPIDPREMRAHPGPGAAAAATG